jgi:hypothetical protein
MTSLRDESEALDVLSKAVARRLSGNRAELTLSNGIVFEFRPVSPLLTASIQAELEQRLPQPPRVWIEEKGREEVNPNDPDYLQELRRQEHLNALALSDAITFAGVEVKSIPEGLCGPDSEEWLKDPRIIVAMRNGLEFDPADPIKRKVVWMRLYALETYIDVRLWDEVQIGLMGMREEEVQAALDGFRSVPERGENLEGTSEATSANGHTDSRAVRRARARVRGT